MCIDEKTWSLAVRLESDILSRVSGSQAAQKLLDEDLRTKTSRIAHMADHYFENQDTFHITGIVADVGRHTESKLSAIRGAIRKVLTDYVEEPRGGQSPIKTLVTSFR